jgi:hypothetical protein
MHLMHIQGSRGIIVAVQVGAVKIYVAAGAQEKRKTERAEPSKVIVF